MTPLKFILRLCLCLALLVLSSGGGFLLRLANGWLDLPQFFGESVLGYYGFQRLLFAAPTGLLVLLATRRVHGLVLALLLSASLYFSLYVNWGTVRDTTGAQVASGVFDWLVGTEDVAWPLWRRWLREFTELNLRGLLMTAVPGFVLYCYNYGTQFFITGAVAGMIYTIGSTIPSSLVGFRTGAELSEFMWGWWVWLVLSVALLCYRHQHPRESFVLPLPIDSTHNSQRWRRAVMAARIVCNFFLLFLLAAFATCSVYYTFVLQADMRQKEQNWLGLVIQTAALCVLYLVYAICKLVLHQVMTRHDCSEPEARAEMLERLKCCCGKARRHHKRGSFFYPADSDSDGVGPLLSISATPSQTQHVQEYRKEKQRMDNEPNKPWRYLLYLVTVIDWLAVLTLIPLCVYVPYTDAYPGSWHLRG